MIDYEILVNKNHPLTDEYIENVIKPNLEKVVYERESEPYINDDNQYTTDIFLEKNTYKAFLLLKKFCHENDILFDIVSGYRSVYNQKLIYEDFKSRNGLEKTINRFALPYYSEHHTGLAIDIDYYKDGDWAGIVPKSNDDSIAFETKFILSNLHKFGFIHRFPKGREEITNTIYEPWHIRYVGVDTATYIYNNDLVLEEYIERKKVK